MCRKFSLACVSWPFDEKLREMLQFNNDYDYDILHAQLVILAVKKILKNKEQFSLEQFVKVLNTKAGARSLLRDVVRLTQLLLVLPTTSAAAERSFSALKRLKTYL